jgi:hypothetical protein
MGMTRADGETELMLSEGGEGWRWTRDEERHMGIGRLRRKVGVDMQVKGRIRQRDSRSPKLDAHTVGSDWIISMCLRDARSHDSHLMALLGASNIRGGMIPRYSLEKLK